MPSLALDNGSTAPSGGPAVWLARRLDESALGDIARGLNHAERRRLGTIRMKADRERFLTGRALARYGLCQASGNFADPASWRFVIGANGKPVVEAPRRDMHFSIAHAGDAIVVAVDPHRQVGVDVERLDIASGAEVVADVLSPGDSRKLGNCPPAKRGREFLKLWTIKEAYAKRSGEGVGMDFAGLDVEWLPDRPDQRIVTATCVIDVRTVVTSFGVYSVAVASESLRDAPLLINFANLTTKMHELQKNCTYNVSSASMGMRP